MTLKEFYELADERTPLGDGKLAFDGNLSPSKRKWLNDSVGAVRVLRDVYGDDPIIKEVCTNLLANFILIDTE
jgi:hypothetical protein